MRTLAVAAASVAVGLVIGLGLHSSAGDARADSSPNVVDAFLAAVRRPAP